MSKSEELIERLITAAVSRDAGLTAAALVIFFYAGLGLAFPLALGWPTAGLVLANILGTLLAGLVVVSWIALQVQAKDRRHLVEWTTNLRLLTAEEFEWLVGEMFRREGWQVRERGRQDSPDGNIDLEITRDGDRALVQCKRWTAILVGVKEVRELGGTLMRGGVPTKMTGILVTLSDFTEAAIAEAQAIGLTLINGRVLYSRIEKVRRAELCEICHEPMILDRSVRGWWLRCRTAGCRGKRDLSAEPGRAIDFLIRPP